MDGIDAGASMLGNWVSSSLPKGAVSSFIADGVIAGVGSVLVFLPQILILFLFIIVLEDSGFLARAAFLMDRVMRGVGLSGQSVIPMLSSFACAVPAIMATRVIPDRRDRIATILAAPFMTCSARLPVYALLIAAFVPEESVGWLNLQGLVLFGLYLLGIFGGLTTAWLMKRSALRGPKPHFSLALPEFRWPNPQTVLIKLMQRARVFLKRAGTVIFSVAVIVWALAYFPRSEVIQIDLQNAIAQAEVNFSGKQLATELQSLQNTAAATQLSHSYLGAIGLGLARVGCSDRRISSTRSGRRCHGHHLCCWRRSRGSQPDHQIAVRYLARRQTGVYPAHGPGYAWCLQCAATLAIIRRETNSWRWPVFAWTYMSVIGYSGALLIYQIGSAL